MRPALIFVLVAFIATAIGYEQLPESLPMRWDLYGHPTVYMPKWWAAWIIPVVTAVVTMGLTWLLPPKRTSFITINAVAGLLCYLCAINLFAAAHSAVSPLPSVFMGMGVFLMVMGNILGKITWNFFLGIRTYWTLDDPAVWERTHRAAGPVYVLGGAAILTAGISQAPTAIPLAILLATCLYPMIYSYIVWRRG
jgi:uncharacterized membrane protein